MTRANIAIRKLTNEHRSKFDCGNDSLNRYFRQQISQDVRKKFASAYVAIEQSTGEVAGYYTISGAEYVAKSVHQEWSANFPRYPVVPAVKIGRLAVARQFQGQGVGSSLVADAADKAQQSPAMLNMLIVEAIDEAAASFYRRCGMRPLLDAPNTYHIPIDMALELKKKS